MIKYQLKCADGHRFESWFENSAAYDRLAKHKFLSCAVCGGPNVEKAVMAPSVAAETVVAKTNVDTTETPAQSRETPNLREPASPAEQAMSELRRHVEDHAEDVGKRFATEARRIHDGSAKDRPIYGESTLADAKSLADDGIPVAPMPWFKGKPN